MRIFTRNADGIYRVRGDFDLLGKGNARMILELIDNCKVTAFIEFCTISSTNCLQVKVFGKNAKAHIANRYEGYCI